MKKLVINKGYTVEVTSWENDGDNYKTKSFTYATKEEALAVKKMCLNLFSSSNNGDSGIGNLMSESYEESKPIILNYLVLNPDILIINNEKSPKDYEKEIKSNFSNKNIGEDWIEYIHDYMDDNEDILDNWVDFIMDYNYSLLGGSEHYLSRIAEKVSIYYSDKDIYLKEI